MTVQRWQGATTSTELTKHAAESSSRRVTRNHIRTASRADFDSLAARSIVSRYDSRTSVYDTITTTPTTRSSKWQFAVLRATSLRNPYTGSHELIYKIKVTYLSFKIHDFHQISRRIGITHEHNELLWIGRLIRNYKCFIRYDTIRYDTIGEFNVDWKAEYSALSSTRSQKKKLKQPTPVPL